MRLEIIESRSLSSRFIVELQIAKAQARQNVRVQSSASHAMTCCLEHSPPNTPVGHVETTHHMRVERTAPAARLRKEKEAEISDWPNSNATSIHL